MLVILIVNLQPTIDDNIDKYQNSKLIDIVTELRAQVGKLEDKVAKLERQLAATSTPKPDACKLNRMTLHSPDCVTFVAIFLTYELSFKGCDGLSNFSLQDV